MRRQPGVFPQPSQQANIGLLFPQLTLRPQGHRDGFEGCWDKMESPFPNLGVVEAKERSAAARAKSVSLCLCP